MALLLQFACAVPGGNDKGSGTAGIEGYLKEVSASLLKEKEAPLFGKAVLGLYKSSEGQSEKENMVLYHLSPPLEKMGFEVKYWDIDRGVPDELFMKNVRAIATWFGSSSLEFPLAYLDFLDSAIDAGRKLLVFDNFGAWETRSGGEETDVDTARVNLTLSKLGIWYLGDWTDNPALLEIGDRDTEIIEGEVSLSEAGFYYRFLSVDYRLKDYLSIKRKDRSYGASPIVVANRNGCFALSNYIYRTKDGKISFLINLEKYLEEALFPASNEQWICLLADPDSLATKRILSFVTEILRHSKIRYSVIPKKEFQFLAKGDLRRFSSVGLVLRSDDGLDPEIISQYLEVGGSVVSLFGGSFNNIASSLAAAPAEIKGILEKNGYRINPGFALTGGIGLVSDDFNWITGGLVPDKDAKILATANGDDYPLLWSASRGRGRVLVWNWDGFSESELLGLTLESFLYVHPVAACATIGIGHMFVDDWPLPMYNIVKEPLEGTDTDFYLNTWWPDVEGMLKSNGIPFSTYMIFNYNAKVTPPFTGGEFYVAENTASIEMARELFSSGTEVEFHGYNHLSLTREKTQVNVNPWPSVSAMEGSLLEGKKTWEALFGPQTLPFSYVAVNNIISQEGIAAVHKIFPSIKIISALKWGEAEETSTELGPHPAIPGIYYVPRMSYGYQSTQNVINIIVSGASSFGFVSHFIHPDDIFDPNRSAGKSWETLRKEFGEILRFIRSNYPWISWKSIKDTYISLQSYDNAEYSFRMEGNSFFIQTENGALIRIRTGGKRLLKMTGCEEVFGYTNMPVIIARATAPLCRLDFAP